MPNQKSDGLLANSCSCCSVQIGFAAGFESELDQSLEAIVMWIFCWNGCQFVQLHIYLNKYVSQQCLCSVEGVHLIHLFQWRNMPCRQIWWVARAVMYSTPSVDFCLLFMLRKKLLLCATHWKLWYFMKFQAKKIFVAQI